MVVNLLQFSNPESEVIVTVVDTDFLGHLKETIARNVLIFQYNNGRQERLAQIRLSLANFVKNIAHAVAIWWQAHVQANQWTYV